MAERRQHGEGSIYQRPARGGRAARWVAVADMGRKGGKRDRREFSAATMERAMDKRKEFLAARHAGFTLPKGRKPYVSEWLRHWLNATARASVSAATFKTYSHKIIGLACPFFEDIYLHELDDEDIEDWHAHLTAMVSARTGRRLSPATIGDAHVITSMAIGVAVRRGRLPYNPLTVVHPPKRDDPEYEPMTVGQTQLVLGRCQTWPTGARWITAITTGMRQGEVLALEWPAVHLARPAHLRVDWSISWVGQEWVRKRPKSKTSRRTVPLPQIAVQALEGYRSAQPVRQLRGGRVFPGRDGRPVHPSVDRHDWYRLLGDCGLPRFRVHDLRHGYATLLLEKGADPRVVMELLGHSSDVMLRRYQHVRQVMHDQAASAIDDAFGAAL